MRVLVTGGAGYIGSTTTAALLRAGHHVTVLDDLRSGHRDAVPDGAVFVEGDIADRAVLADVLASGIDACMHFAASIEAGESMLRPEAFFANNTAKTLMLLDVLVNAGVERFVLSSTAAVYGDPETTPIDEGQPTRPTNAYGASKLLIEHALEWLGELRALRWAALRYFNAAGSGGERGERHDPETHLIPLILQVAAGTRDEVLLFGTDYPTADGTCVRDFVHVEDLAAAHVAALEALAKQPHLVCNLGTGRGFTVLEVVEAARRVTGHTIPIVRAERRAGDPAVLVAAADRARELLGWTAQHTAIDDIVASAWAWHQRASRSVHDAVSGRESAASDMPG